MRHPSLGCRIETDQGLSNQGLEFEIPPPKTTLFCDSLEPNKHWSKRLRFGEEFSSAKPTSGVLPTEHHPKSLLLVALPCPDAAPRLLYI